MIAALTQLWDHATKQRDGFGPILVRDAEKRKRGKRIDASLGGGRGDRRGRQTRLVRQIDPY